MLHLHETAFTAADIAQDALSPIAEGQGDRRELKAICDPDNLLNPADIVEPAPELLASNV